MSKAIDEKTVKHVAHLSRLSLNEKELALYCRQLADILIYINKLKEVNTEGVQPTTHVLSSLKNVFRRDSPRASLKPEDVLKNAPSQEGGFFRVPQIIEGK